MKSLSLERINETAPYRVTQGRKANHFDFVSDSGVEFSVGFDEDVIITADDSYQFTIANVNHKPSPHDYKVRDTVISIVDNFFRENNATVLYICDTSDGRQELRNRLFMRWFMSYKCSSRFVVTTATLKDTEGVDNYTTLIIRNDNPRLAAILAEFSEIVELLGK